MTVKRIRASAAYRAVVSPPSGIPRWARFVLGPGLIGLGVWLFLHGFKDLYSLIVMGAGTWALFPDLDEALARVLGAWRGKDEPTPTARADDE